MSRKRSNHSPDEKVVILRRHLLDDVAVSDLCEEYGLRPNLFYSWQKQFFENGAAAFGSGSPAEGTSQKKRIADLEARLTRKHEVLSELMEEHLRLKKALGEP